MTGQSGRSQVCSGDNGDAMQLRHSMSDSQFWVQHAGDHGRRPMTDRGGTPPIVEKRAYLLAVQKECKRHNSGKVCPNGA